MTSSLSECEELVAPRCTAPQVAKDDAGAKDKATRKVAPQPVQAASSASTALVRKKL